MFYPRAMSEIELIVPTRDLLAVTKVLSSEGVFQQSDSNSIGQDGGNKANKDNTWQNRAATYASLERRIQNILQVMNADEGFPPSKEKDQMVEISSVQPLVESIEAEAKETIDQLANEQKLQEQLGSMLSQMEPVSDVDVEVSLLRSPRYLFSQLGTMPTDNIARMRTSLSRVPHVFIELRQDAHNAVVWLAGARQNADILDRAARSAYLNPVSLPENYQGTPAVIIRAIRGDIEQSKKKTAQLSGDLAKLAKKHAGELRDMLWSVRTSRLLADAIVRFGRLQYTYVVVGWVFTSHMEDLTQRIKQVSKETLIETFPLRRDTTNIDVPVALHNPRFMRPFQTLVTTYARPMYNELDPTFLIAITFPLLFGAMFGDAGQGAVLAVLGWLVANRKIKALAGMADLGGLVMVCGVVAAVFGFLYGSFFGIEHLLPALWLHPLENIMQILILAIGVGVVILVAGFLIGMFNAWVARDWGRLLFDRNGVAGFILYLTMLAIVAGTMTGRTILPMPVAVVLLVISGVAIMLSEVLKRLVEGHRPLIVEGIGTYAIQAFFELFETLISFLSNSLSYVRVGAFAVAHAGLSQVIFILAALASPGHGVVYWIVVAIGNVFIIGFEGLIVGIQTMRLEYYEFFSKFFKGGGTSYEPLTLRPTENE
jgi:V/A-type H+/Na+-transporting ATPase subunit I